MESPSTSSQVNDKISPRRQELRKCEQNEIPKVIGQASDDAIEFRTANESFASIAFFGKPLDVRTGYEPAVADRQIERLREQLRIPIARCQAAFVELDPARLIERIAEARNTVLDRIEDGFSRSPQGEQLELRDALQTLSRLHRMAERDNGEQRKVG
jgi:hypothetical protein